MSTARRVIKNTGFLYAKMGITMFISLYSTRLVLNALGASDFGIFNIVGGAIAMLGFLNTAMASATQRFMSYSEGVGDKEKQKKIFNISVVLHFFIAIILGGGVLVAGYFFFNGVLNIGATRISAAKVVYGSLIISTMFTVMTVPYDAILNARENMLYYAIVGIIESVMKLGVALIVVYLEGDKLIIYGILMALIPIVNMTIMRLYCHRKYEECIIAPRRYWDKDLMKEMADFAGWNLLGSSSSMVGNYGIGLLLNHFFGPVLNASFGIAAQLNGQLVTFSNNMMKALNPAIVKAEGEGERQNMLSLSLNGCKYSLFLFSLFAIPFLLEMPFLLKLWLKNVPIWAVIFCRLALFRTLLEQITQPLNTAIGAQGNIKSYLAVRSLLFLIPLPTIYLLFENDYPPYVMLIVTLLIGGVFDGVNTLYFACKNCQMQLSEFFDNVANRMVIVLFLSTSISVVPLFIIDESIYRLFLVIILSTISFLLFFYIIGLKQVEKDTIKSIFKKIKDRFFFFNL